MDVDPITLAVIHAGLEQIADEMDATLERMAFSPVISDGFDRASGVYRPDGELIVQGPRGLPNFISVMAWTVGSVAKRIRDVHPDDVYIVNDPYLGGTHLMDVKMVKPFFYRGEFIAFLANTGHWPDIGGRVPGGFSSRATEIYQEGLRLPPVRLFDRGKLAEDLLDIVFHNVRVPDERYGDIIAQVTGLTVGAERLTRFLDRYGKDTVFAVIDEMQGRGERLMRDAIATIPSGTYVFEDYLDSDGIEQKPLTIHLELTINGDEATLDFSRSSAPCQGPLNSVLATTIAGAHIAFRHVFPEIPVNQGCFRPFNFHIPTTTFLNARPPRPVAGCAAEVCQRIIDVVLGALAQAIPEKTYAAPMGTVTNVAVGGEDPRHGYYVFYSFIGGGYGGNARTDGLINGNPTIALARTQSLEVLEFSYPVLFREYSIRNESGGAGRSRGGMGVVLEFELRRGEARASILGDRGCFAPFGLLGGKSAQMAHHTFILGGQSYEPPHVTKDEGVFMQAGDVLRLRTPGGGGYGNPLERPVESVLRDVRREYYSRATAKGEYGVILDEETLEIDLESTVRLRERLAQSSYE